LEVLAIKRFKNGFGIGFVESWIQQVTDDGGPTGEALNGFVGRAFGIGPIDRSLNVAMNEGLIAEVSCFFQALSIRKFNL
jgi:hypothetical protein